ncbi:MAG: bifunctional hydroxymethylpyrimidine kinase/phosphomethylpyrimidine kinase [Acidobacteriota bacterium]|nr:bifunctional hydroxymethylpyrimidine kinase/phosphomethylpyrimidine kinase [Acidobacteriota bacterium]
MIAWTIAGSDSGGGAGIQADLKTFQGLGVHGCTVLVALTAQNTREVRAARYVDTELIRQQIDVLREDLPAKALKTGMLGSAEIMRVVADALETLDAWYVCDPVMVATSGGRLMDREAEQILAERLLPRADLITPNLPEAEVLCGRPIRSPEEVEEAAHMLLQRGARGVLVKGGHGDSEFSQDFFTDGDTGFWLTGRRIDSISTHGTGCTLSAALAACVARGYATADALVIARAYVTAGIREARPVGGGHGPVFQGGWPSRPADLPWLTRHAADGRDRPTFPDCGNQPIGFYPLVDRAARLVPLAESGVTTAQLRIKDLSGEALKREIADAAAVARRFDLRLFINDHWREAVDAGAYGVHLGQEDLEDADIRALAESGLRLGISTHGYAELARAAAYRPSYIALGPVFATQSKQLDTRPHGLEGLARWRRLVAGPLVAIGGIGRERASDVREAGADGIAVMSAINDVDDLHDELSNWNRLFS